VDLEKENIALKCKTLLNVQLLKNNDTLSYSSNSIYKDFQQKLKMDISSQSKDGAKKNYLDIDSEISSLGNSFINIKVRPSQHIKHQSQKIKLHK